MNAWNDDLDNDDNNSGGGALRGQLEEALKKLKAAETRAAKAERQIAVSTVSTSLKDKGYKESAAKFAALDGVDLSDEGALTKWLENDGQDFKLPESDQSHESGVVDPPDDSHEELAQFNNNADRLRNSASPADQNRYIAALKSLPADATPEQVDAAFAGL